MTRRVPYNPDLPIRVAANAHFACRTCGGSCRSYDVLLTEREARRLDMAWWRPLLNGVPDNEPLVQLDAATGQYTLNRVDDRCVFLDSDNLCIVHKAAGVEAKPIACRLFPLHVVQAPDSLRASLNVGCRRLIDMSDADPLLEMEDARSLLGQIQGVASIGEEIAFTPDVTISYEEYADWRVKLLGILAEPQESWTGLWEQLQKVSALLRTSPGTLIELNADGLALFRTLADLIDRPQGLRPTLRALYSRTREAVDSVSANGLRLPEMPSEVRPEFCAAIARQWLEGDQGMLHRTARTGWTALLAGITLGLYAAQIRIMSGDRSDYALNEAMADAFDLWFAPAGQLALTEPNQEEFLASLAGNGS